MPTIAYAAKEITTMGISIGILKISSLNNSIALKKLEKATNLLTSSSADKVGASIRIYNSAVRYSRCSDFFRTLALKVHKDPRIK